MKLIDGDELCGIESLLNTDIVQNSTEAAWLMSQVLHDIQAMNTIDPETIPIVRQLREELARVTEKSDATKRRWIPCSERLPEDKRDGETVLCVVSGKPHENITLRGAIMTAGYFVGEGWVVNEYPEWENPIVTHWMPLPQPPKEENFCQFCGQPLRQIGEERFCSNVNCKNRYVNV